VLWAQSGDAPMTVFTFTPIVVILVYPEWICRAHTTLFGLPVRPCVQTAGKTSTASVRGAKRHQEVPVLMGFLELVFVGCVKIVPEIRSVSVASSFA
jgi:hypothetical protein